MAPLPRDYFPSISTIEARDTVVLVCTSLAVILLVITVGFGGYKVCKVIQHKIAPASHDANGPKFLPSKHCRIQNSVDSMAMASPCHFREGKSHSTFFRPLRKASTVPTRLPPGHATINPSMISEPRKLGATRPQGDRYQTMASIEATSPHTAAWIYAADSVVGVHPHTQPLHSRVSTQAEIDIISGHVHIPWARENSLGTKPLAVKIQPPTFPRSDPPALPSPTMFRDLSNIPPPNAFRRTSSTQLKPPVLRSKGKQRIRGKENMPAVPGITSSSTSASRRL